MKCQLKQLTGINTTSPNTRTLFHPHLKRNARKNDCRSTNTSHPSSPNHVQSSNHPSPPPQLNPVHALHSPVCTTHTCTPSRATLPTVLNTNHIKSINHTLNPNNISYLLYNQLHIHHITITITIIVSKYAKRRIVM